jgi:hypothetical protein
VNSNQEPSGPTTPAKPSKHVVLAQHDQTADLAPGSYRDRLRVIAAGGLESAIASRSQSAQVIVRCCDQTATAYRCHACYCLGSAHHACLLGDQS